VIVSVPNSYSRKGDFCEGRFTVANRADLEAWIAKESGMPKPPHVFTGDTDISAALKDSIKAVRHTEKK
jgi:hypothetical protein